MDGFVLIVIEVWIYVKGVCYEFCFDYFNIDGYWSLIVLLLVFVGVF